MPVTTGSIKSFASDVASKTVAKGIDRVDKIIAQQEMKDKVKQAKNEMYQSMFAPPAKTPFPNNIG